MIVLPPLNILIIKWIILSLSLFLAGLCFGKRVRIIGITPLLLVTLFIAPINVFYEDVALLIGLPHNHFYLSLTAIVLNSIAIYLSTHIVPDFRVENFSVAFFLALIMSGINFLLISFLSGTR